MKMKKEQYYKFKTKIKKNFTKNNIIVSIFKKRFISKRNKWNLCWRIYINNILLRNDLKNIILETNKLFIYIENKKEIKKY